MLTEPDGDTFVDVDLTASDPTLQDVIDAVHDAAVSVAPNRLTLKIDNGSLNSLILTDAQALGGNLTVESLNGSLAAVDLGILRIGSGGYLTGLPISDTAADLRVDLSDGTRHEWDLSGLETLADVIERLNLEDPHFSAEVSSATGRGLVLRDTSGGAGAFTVSSLNGSSRGPGPGHRRDGSRAA